MCKKHQFCCANKFRRKCMQRLPAVVVLRRNAATKLCDWLRCKNSERHCFINLTLEAWNPINAKGLVGDFLQAWVPPRCEKCSKYYQMWGNFSQNFSSQSLNFSNFTKYIFWESGGISRGSAGSDNEIFAAGETAAAPSLTHSQTQQSVRKEGCAMRMLMTINLDDKW